MKLEVRERGRKRGGGGQTEINGQNAILFAEYIKWIVKYNTSD